MKGEEGLTRARQVAFQAPGQYVYIEAIGYT